MTESFGLSYKWESRRTVESRIANALEENLSLELDRVSSLIKQRAIKGTT